MEGIKKPEILIVLTGLIGIIVLESIALLKGINGTAMSAALTAIGGICGFYINSLTKKKDGEK